MTVCNWINFWAFFNFLRWYVWEIPRQIPAQHFDGWAKHSTGFNRNPFSYFYENLDGLQIKLHLQIRVESIFFLISWAFLLVKYAVGWSKYVSLKTSSLELIRNLYSISNVLQTNKWINLKRNWSILWQNLKMATIALAQSSILHQLKKLTFLICPIN